MITEARPDTADTHGGFWRIEFAEPIQVPLALGLACHYGLGLFVGAAFSTTGGGAMGVETGELQAAGWSAPPCARTISYRRPLHAIKTTAPQVVRKSNPEYCFVQSGRPYRQTEASPAAKA